MTRTTTRRRFLKRAAVGAGAAAAASTALPASARAATLDASFTSPYPPHPVIGHRSSWFVYTALIRHVIMPYDVVVCNRQLGPLPAIDGAPDLRAVPSDATMLLLFLRDPVHVNAVTAPDISDAIQLSKGKTMRFSDLGGGQRNWQGFRNFIGWYIATLGDTLYSMGVNVYVGPDAGNEWSEVQPIVDSIHLPA